MSDSDAYSYEYDEDDDSAAEASFEYTDDEENSKQDDAAINIENTYYNAKASRDNGEYGEAVEGLESVVGMEVEMMRGQAGVEDGEIERA